MKKWICCTMLLLTASCLFAGCANGGSYSVIFDFEYEDTSKTEENKEADAITNSVKFLGKEKIYNAAGREFYHLKGVSDISNDIASVCEKDEMELYKLNHGKAEKLDFSYTQVEDTIQIAGEEYAVQFLYGMLDGERLVVMTEDDNTYLLDLENKQGESLQELIGLKYRMDCSFIDNTLLSVAQQTEKREQQMDSGVPAYNFYTHHIGTGELETGYRYERKDSIVLGYGYFIEMLGEDYVLVTRNGGKFRIEGIKNINNRYLEGTFFKLSRDQKKIIVVTNNADGSESGIEAQEVGVIDIEKREMTIYQIDNVGEDFVSQLSWVDNCILIQKGEGDGIYLYRFN